jgi:hypothetical protein
MSKGKEVTVSQRRRFIIFNGKYFKTIYIT